MGEADTNRNMGDEAGANASDEGIRMGREHKRTSYRGAANLTLVGDFLAKPAARRKNAGGFFPNKAHINPPVHLA